MEVYTEWQKNQVAVENFVKEFGRAMGIAKEDAQKVDGILNVTVNSDDHAVKILTSGTTGKIKGVLLSAYNIINAAQVNAHDQTLRTDDKDCVILPFFSHIREFTGGRNNLFAGKIRIERLMPNNQITSSYGLSEITLVSIIEYDDSRENILYTVGKPDSNGIGQMKDGFRHL